MKKALPRTGLAIRFGISKKDAESCITEIWGSVGALEERYKQICLSVESLKEKKEGCNPVLGDKLQSISRTLKFVADDLLELHQKYKGMADALLTDFI